MILITGASRGIGEFLIRSFRDKGEIVSGTYNSTTPDPALEDIMVKVDITSLNSIESWINSLQSDLKNIVLINCASISYTIFAHKSDLNKWRKVIDVNLIGTFNVIHSLLPLMRDQGYGRIINFSSVVAQLPTPGVSAYAASKSALWGLAKSLAAENGSKGITINNINMGYANLGMGIRDVPPAYQLQMKKRIPSEKFCEPENILKAVEFLIEAEYMNGSTIDLNGALI
jgi:NAD(P)-dependent dehydrogenase (short-subunit alcohol dehydrogenase family)